MNSTDSEIPWAELILLKQAGRLLTRSPDERPPHMGVLHRWARGRGIGGIQLRSVKVRGRIYTTSRWLSEFIEQTSRPTPRPSAPANTAAQRERRLVSAEKELASLGL